MLHAAHRKTRRRIPWLPACSDRLRRTAFPPSPPWSMPLPATPSAARSAADPGVVFTLDGSDRLGHHRIHVAVRQSARLVLQNQAHSETLESRLDALADVTVEQVQVAQQGPAAWRTVAARSAQATCSGTRNARSRRTAGKRDSRARQSAGGQRLQVQLEGVDVGFDIHRPGQSRVDLADPADRHAIAEHLGRTRRVAVGADGRAELQLRATGGRDSRSPFRSWKSTLRVGRPTAPPAPHRRPQRPRAGFPAVPAGRLRPAGEHAAELEQAHAAQLAGGVAATWRPGPAAATGASPPVRPTAGPAAPGRRAAATGSAARRRRRRN